MDESMFEDIHEMAENTAYLKAVEEKDVSLEMWESLPPYGELGELEAKLQADGHINFDTIFHEPTGFYLIKCFLIADYSGDKALFVKDVESYKSMRFESARKRISKLIYRRYIAPDELEVDEADQYASVFTLAKQKKYLMLDDEEKSDNGRGTNSVNSVSNSGVALRAAPPGPVAPNGQRSRHGSLAPGLGGLPEHLHLPRGSIVVGSVGAGTGSGSADGQGQQPALYAPVAPGQQPQLLHQSPAPPAGSSQQQPGANGGAALPHSQSQNVNLNQQSQQQQPPLIPQPPAGPCPPQGQNQGQSQNQNPQNLQQQQQQQQSFAPQPPNGTHGHNGSSSAVSVVGSLPASHSQNAISHLTAHSQAQQFPGSATSAAPVSSSTHGNNSSNPLLPNSSSSSALAQLHQPSSSQQGTPQHPHHHQNSSQHTRGESFESSAAHGGVGGGGSVLAVASAADPAHSHFDPASVNSLPSVSQRPQYSSLGGHGGSTHSRNHAPEKSVVKSMLAMGESNNNLGVYGKPVNRVREMVERDDAPADLFDDLQRVVLDDLQMDVFPRFLKSEFYQKYIRTKHIETVRVGIRDFTTFRVLGRGGFGAVHACRKKNSGTIYAMKCINKKLVKVKKALDNVLEERTVLAMMNSNFVTNLKYGLQDEETLYLIMDLMLGGDLKFHLINAGRFTEKRARFYAAEVLLGLEHVHQKFVIYRDMKLENVLLDHQGHCKISDLGLAVVTKSKIKGYAGTPGYTSPEMIHNRLYGPGTDIFSYGVMLYRMLCGSKPFKGRLDRELDKAVINRKPQFPKEIFSKDAIDLLTGLLQKQPDHRLGCGEAGIDEIKAHPFFADIDWGLLEAGYVDPPFVPNRFDVNAASLKDIGDFDRAKYRHVKLDERFKHRVRNFDFVSIRGLQEEMVSVLEKLDQDVNYEKFRANRGRTGGEGEGGRQQTGKGPCGQCCVLL